MRVWLSPSRLSLFKDCPRCFFDEVFLKLKRPRGAYPTLPSAIDEMMKAYCDRLRAQAVLPEQLAGFVDGMELFGEQVAIDRLRDWKGGLSWTHQVTREYEGKAVSHELQVSGSVDDLLFDPDTDTFAIPDFKTRREAPDEGYSKKYYQTSMDAYAYLLEKMGWGCNGRAILWYLWPKEVTNIDHETLNIVFGSTCQELQVDGSETEQLLEQIADIVPRDSILPKYIDAKRPNVNPDCEYCNFKRQK